MAYPTFYASPSVIAPAAFAAASGLVSFRRTVIEAGGTFAGKNDLGAIVFRGSRALASVIASAGYDVTVLDGPPPDSRWRLNTKRHAQTGAPTAWAATRRVGVKIEG